MVDKEKLKRTGGIGTRGRGIDMGNIDEIGQPVGIGGVGDLMGWGIRGCRRGSMSGGSLKGKGHRREVRGCWGVGERGREGDQLSPWSQAVLKIVS